MACESCSTGGGCSTSGGCGSKGGCAKGGCNRLNTFDWLTDIDTHYAGVAEFDIIEVSFKQGSRKAFFRKPHSLRVQHGDFVAVESTGGYDIGMVSLSGELVRLQMKRKKVKESGFFPPVLRIANPRDMERLAEARSEEKEVLVRARAAARAMNMDMKIGDVEFQGDKRKVTFYYTADGRIDFRELIKIYARDFKVRIEMRQIGARQETARLGGLGPCGRELCCSTWLADFKTVSTGSARYQNLAINQSKLTGQCGRLKCCLNYELDAYVEVFRQFPRNADRIHTQSGTAELIKTDIFKRMMFYMYRDKSFSKIFALSIEQVKEIQAMNAKGIKPGELVDETVVKEKTVYDEIGFVDVTGEIQLKPEQKKKKKKSKNKNRRPPQRDKRE